MISQLMTQLNKLMKLEKYQQGKVMIIQLVAYRLFAADLSKQKALDADLRTIQQVIFTGKIKSAVANAKVIIYNNFNNLKQRNELHNRNCSSS